MMKPVVVDRPRRLWWLLIGVVACYFACFAFYPDWFLYVGIRHYGAWFLDSFAILASNDALTRGLDVYRPNPLDYFGRPHVYSSWWLSLRDVGLTRADNFRVGLTLGLVFLAAAVTQLRPRTSSQLLWYVAVLASSPVLLALERGNNDIVVFLVLTPVVSCLLSASLPAQCAAGLLIALATGLKFYPATAALVLLAPGPRAIVRWRLGVAALALLVTGMSVLPGYLRVRHMLPAAEGLMSFDAATLFKLAHLAGPAKPLSAGAGMLTVVLWWRSDMFRGWEIPEAVRAKWLRFVMGSAVLTGCFFSGATSYAYRWVFAIWLAPWLWWLTQETAASHKIRRLARITMALLGGALWIDPIIEFALVNFVGHVPNATITRAVDLAYGVEQPFTWALFICLLGFLTAFVRQALTQGRGAALAAVE